MLISFILNIFLIAATVEFILILCFIMQNVRHYLFEPSDRRTLFSFSIVLSALGIVFAIIGCVDSIVVYHKSREEDLKRKYFTMDHVIPLTDVEQELLAEE